MQDTATDSASRPLARWQVAAAVLFVAAQALLPPAVVFTSEHRPAPFAWQMFSRGTPLVRFDVTYDDGRVIRYGPADLVVKDRGDIPFARLLPPLLCRQAGARLVRTETADRSTTIACP